MQQISMANKLLSTNLEQFLRRINSPLTQIEGVCFLFELIINKI